MEQQPDAAASAAANAAANAAAAADAAARRAQPVTMGQLEDLVTRYELASVAERVERVRADAATAVSAQISAGQQLEGNVTSSLAKTKALLEGLVADARAKFLAIESTMGGQASNLR